MRLQNNISQRTADLTKQRICRKLIQNTPDKSLLRFGQIVEQYADRIGGIFCGDSHFDTEFRIGNVPGFVSQGYGGVLESSMPSGARKTPFDSAETVLAEIVVFRPEWNRIDLLRMGVKDAEADRSAQII